MIVYDDKSGGFLMTIWIGIPALIGIFVIIIWTSLQIVGVVVWGGLTLLVPVYVITQYVRWRRINQQRQTAASSAQSLIPLVAMQPDLDEQALLLPFTLRLKVNWRAHLSWNPIYIILVLVISFVVYDGDWFEAFRNDRNLIPFLSIIVISIVGSLFRRPKIQVTHNALMIGLSTLRWSDARLFAIRGRVKPGDQARQFELSSAKDALVWEYLRPHPWWSPYKPPMPREEYVQQMARLLEFIAAKTKLSLYDVR